MQFGILMASGKTYEVDARNGDEAKQIAYTLALKDAGPNTLKSDPRRRVASVTPLDK